MPSSVKQTADFPQRIVAWQQQHGRHDLPWQGSNAYHVWLSEIMLQQTQVVKVLEYFDRFISVLPDLPALAAASEQEVLALWSGLGYYNRARYLHRSARLCVEKHQGELPRTMADLEALPGIGRSTAAAIMSLAFELPEPIMDGNVKRVFARHFLVSGEPNSGPTLKRLWALAEAHRSEDNPRAYTQGLMDLGAGVCSKNQPQCGHCPIQSSCEAFATDQIADFPEKKKRVSQKHLTMHVLLAESDDRLYLQQRDGKGIWPQLWFLPSFDDEAALQQAAVNARHRFTITHQLTHRRLTIPVYTGELKKSQGGAWFNQNELVGTPHPKALIHIMEQHHNERNHHLH